MTAVKNAVVIVLFTSDIWRSLTVLIKFSLCQLRNTTQFSSLLLLTLPWHFRSRLFQDCIAKLVIAMKIIIECHQYVEKEISLSYQVDLASEWETHLLFIPWWTLSACTWPGVLAGHYNCRVLPAPGQFQYRSCLCVRKGQLLPHSWYFLPYALAYNWKTQRSTSLRSKLRLVDYGFVKAKTFWCHSL